MSHLHFEPAAGEETNLSFHRLTQVATRVDAVGKTTQYVRDQHGNIIYMIESDPDGMGGSGRSSVTLLATGAVG